MSQEIKFNFEKSVDAAIKLFWKEGYQQTSLKSLLNAMKIGESSFYNTYKSKEKLYLTCLEQYNCKTISSRVNALNSKGTITEKIDRFFDVIFGDFEKRGTNQGCLMTNSLSYDVLKNRILKTYVQKQMDNFGSLLIKIFEQAKSKKELSSTFDTELKTKLFITHLQGIFLMSMTDASLKDLRLQTNSFILSFFITN